MEDAAPLAHGNVGVRTKMKKIYELSALRESLGSRRSDNGRRCESPPQASNASISTFRLQGHASLERMSNLHTLFTDPCPRPEYVAAGRARDAEI